jgi:hypothetical protein
MLFLPPAGYLDACGGGLQMQIGRTVSVDKTLGKASLNRDGSASFMLEPDSLQDEVRARCAAWLSAADPCSLCIIYAMPPCGRL